MQNIAQQLNSVREKVRSAERKYARPENSVSLLAVSKTRSVAEILQAIEQGQLDFGENYQQEVKTKLPALSGKDINWHFIGPLQSNKARQAMELFDAIHSLDRPKLATALARLAQELGQCPDVFVQVNTGQEPQKAGILPADADGFITRCRELDLPVRGVMCLPPSDEEPALHFALLAKIAARNGLSGLSMGMSGDFERAIAQGATHIRVGSAIFGDRTTAQ